MKEVKVYAVAISALYHVRARSEKQAKTRALENMKLEIQECPENMKEFDIEICLEE